MPSPGYCYSVRGGGGGVAATIGTVSYLIRTKGLVGEPYLSEGCCLRRSSNDPDDYYPSHLTPAADVNLQWID
eukprot:scaffold1503_cov150-Ochromonas_danica.AAC.20